VIHPLPAFGHPPPWNGREKSERRGGWGWISGLVVGWGVKPVVKSLMVV
jgi:hypothetical protein